MNHLLSIIVPVYNTENYINRCIESILNQTYSNFELILIDDGSTDTSSYKCDEYAKKDIRVTVLHKENGGVSSARNLGISIAKGDIIAFVDSDDCLDCQMYEILIKNMDETNASISACSYVTEYKTDICLLKDIKKIPKPIVFKGRRQIYESMTRENDSIEGFLWNKIYTKNCLSEIQFRKDLFMMEDVVFLWEIVQGIEVACYVDLPMYHYSILSTSITRSSSIDKLLTALDGYEIILKKAESISQKCYEDLAVQFLILNSFVFQRLVFSEKFDKKLVYKRIKNNIKYMKKMIKKVKSKKSQIMIQLIMQNYYVAYIVELVKERIYKIIENIKKFIDRKI